MGEGRGLASALRMNELTAAAVGSRGGASGAPSSGARLSFDAPAAVVTLVGGLSAKGFPDAQEGAFLNLILVSQLKRNRDDEARRSKV
jgi:hypothetical protein